MGSYAQWKAGARKGNVRRFTYVCGEERVLVDEVLSAIRDILGLSPYECTYTTAGTVPESEIWELCSTYPGLGRRLIVVHNAELLRNWLWIEHLIEAGRDLTGLYVVFHSRESGFPLVEGQLPRHLAALRDSSAGQLVKCSTPAEGDLLEWVRGRLPGVGKVLASYILQRCGGDLTAAAALCAKAQLFGDKVNEAVVDVLCQEQPADDFADSLVHIRRLHALECAYRMSESEMAKALALLESRLDTLALLNKGVRLRMPESEMRMKLQLHPFLIKKFKDVAGKYDQRRVRSCRRTLAVAQGAWNSGVREGVAEVLVALW